MKDVQKTTNKQEEIIQNLTKLSELKIILLYFIYYIVFKIVPAFVYEFRLQFASPTLYCKFIYLWITLGPHSYI